MTDTLATLRAQFVERCRHDLIELSRGRADGDAFDSRVHRLAGAAGSFGFPDVSAAAGAVDLRIRRGDVPSSAEVEALVEALERATGARNGRVDPA